MTAVNTEPNLSFRAAVTLLAAVGLPSSDLTEPQLEHFLFSGPRNAPTGLVGLELYDSVALLRSLAVAPNAQRSGLGTTLLEQAEGYAYAHGVRSLYLLTTTAQRFFESRGYRLTSRESCPASIRSTSEFVTLCPASSALLVKTWLRKRDLL
ncbi:MAG: arsenic resistance N-acetyltransferase ArsN2 [Steroidobacteraceae bacterium]